MRRLLLLLAFVALGCSGVSAQGTVRALRYVTTASSQTCADNGNGGTASSVTLTVAEVGYIALTQSDAQGCALTLSESGAVDGQMLTIVDISANAATLSNSSGVQQTNAGVAITFAQYDSAVFQYRSDRWVEVSRSQPQVGTTNTATLTNKTLTCPTLTTGVQLCATTITLTDAQIKALPTTPITVVAAAGASTLIQPQFAYLFAKTSAGAYTNINAAGSLTLAVSGYGGMGFVPNDASITAGSKTRLTDLLGSATNHQTQLSAYFDTEGVDGWGPVGVVQTMTSGVNQPLQVTLSNGGSGNLTGGNAANTLTVVVTYVVVAVP